MARSVAFLRGINLGRRRVTNEELVRIVGELGVRDVSAYQAAGNLIFEDAGRSDVGPEMSAGFEAALGYPVRVFVRTRDEVVALGSADPFTASERERSGGKVQVTMLAAPPTPEQRAQVEAIGTADDVVRVVDAHWFWLPAAGISQSQLDLSAIERIVGLGTTRTQGTLQRLAKRLG